jgi:hypothetical protein
MESEKVKEIKKVLEQNDDNGIMYEVNDEKRTCKFIHHKDILTLINELESENERLLQQRNKTYNIWVKDTEKLKDRIAELEEALLDMVVQFCQMGKEGYLHHTFMSAEENAFDVLDIEYGEKVDDVYKRFNERWGKKDER